MAGTARSAKDAAMAADMKARGVKRATMRCPMCHGLIGIVGLFTHLGVCKAGPRGLQKVR